MLNLICKYVVNIVCCLVEINTKKTKIYQRYKIGTVMPSRQSYEPMYRSFKYCTNPHGNNERSTRHNTQSLYKGVYF